MDWIDHAESNRYGIVLLHHSILVQDFTILWHNQNNSPLRVLYNMFEKNLHLKSNGVLLSKPKKEWKKAYKRKINLKAVMVNDGGLCSDGVYGGRLQTVQSFWLFWAVELL